MDAIESCINDPIHNLKVGSLKTFGNRLKELSINFQNILNQHSKLLKEKGDEIVVTLVGL